MTSEKVIHTKNSEETFKLGQKIAKDLKGGEVIALHGDLGSGKTVFAQGVAYGLGLRSRITSPTFLKKGGENYEQRNKIRNTAYSY